MPVNAIRAITRCMEDINAHTSEVADANTPGVGNWRNIAQRRSRSVRRRCGRVRVADGTVTRDARI
jgi:hypothetical protein